MSDKQYSSLTPIAVGVVIAVIGILTGFYVADNANEQLAALQAQLTDGPLTDHSATPAKSLQSVEQTDMQELPPLDPITEVPEMLPEEEEPVATEQADVEEPAETPKTDEAAPADEPGKPEEPTKAEPAKDDVPADVPNVADEDDFEEVPPEELKEAANP